MRAELLAYLLEDAGVTALAAQRVSWGRRLQGSALPAMVLNKIDGPDDWTLDGPSGFVDARVQADCFAATQLAASQLAAAARAAFAAVSTATTGGVIQAVVVTHEQDEFEGEKPDTIFRTRLALRVPYNAS